MNSIRRVLTYGGGVVGTLGGAVASRTSVESHTPALSDAQHVVEDDMITIQPQAREGSRSLHMRSDAEMDTTMQQKKPEDISGYSRASLVEHLHEIERNPIHRDEIDCLMESDSSRYYELVPPQMRSSVVLDSKLFEFGRELLSRDPELATTVSRSLASMLMVSGNNDTTNDTHDEHKQSTTESNDELAESEDAFAWGSATIVQSRHGIEGLDELSYASVGASLVSAGAETSVEWKTLREQYPCTICQDVMCAPHLVVECAHSFCGACILQHIEINSQDSDIICCPKCRHPIERSPCYEPDFDSRILADVEAAPACESKNYWTERHAVLIDNLRRRRRQSGRGKDSQQSTAGWLWEKLQDNMAGVIAVVALILIVVAAKRSGR